MLDSLLTFFNTLVDLFQGGVNGIFDAVSTLLSS